MLTNTKRNKLTPTQSYILFFILGIVAGAAAFIWKNDIFFPTMSLYHELNSNKLSSDSIDKNALFYYILEKRLHEFAILFLTQITILRHPAACVYSFIFGFAGALLEGFYVQEYSILGIAIFLLTIFPHFLFYALAWHKICTSHIFATKLTSSTLISALKVIALFILFALAGIMCESSLNLLLLKIIFQKFV